MKTLRGKPTTDQKAEDRALVEAVLAGDSTAYRGLVERYQRRVYALVCGMVRDKEDARDITQEAFVKAYKNLDRFRLESSFYTWLYRIAMNLAIDHLRKFKKRRHSEFDEGVASYDAEGDLHSGHSLGNASRELERKQLHGRILSALDKLSPDHKQIILLREVEGFSYKEIADALEIAEGTVMSRLFYARRKLQAALKGERD
ncbi:MAG TPA: sigma-70 family RNA polymerase sigma factor [Myxococcota bacterium]|nr:sigma-70 family RNA polymerase sigma factor [Myxococcota bacterium]